MTAHPSCIGELDSRWPWPQRLAGLQVVTTRFDAGTLEAADFERCQISAPSSVCNAIAKRQAEYLAGRLCAREALRHTLGLDAVPMTGKDGAPQWPSHSVGSITHSTGIASAIVALQDQYDSLGLDIEPCINAKRARRLTTRILTSAEQNRFANTLKTDPGALLTLVFSLKESLFKALYPLTRTRFYFKHAELLDWQPDGTVQIRLLTSLGEDWPEGTTLDGLYAKTATHYLSLIAIKARGSAFEG